MSDNKGNWEPLVDSAIKGNIYTVSKQGVASDDSDSDERREEDSAEWKKFHAMKKPNKVYTGPASVVVMQGVKGGKLHTIVPFWLCFRMSPGAQN